MPGEIEIFGPELAFKTIKDVYKVTVPEGYEKYYVEEFSKFPEVLWVEENKDIEIEINYIPNDPNYDRQWHIPWIHADTVLWDSADIVNMDPVTIAVIDTGVDTSHEDLQGKIWQNTEEIPDNGIDDDGNGYVDDTCGYDWVNRNLTLDVDEVGHGTHVAGIIGATMDNSIGGAGVLPCAKIMVLKTFESNGTMTFSQLGKIAEAIDYAVFNGAKVINMSFGTGEDSMVIREALMTAHGENILLVASAGNDGKEIVENPNPFQIGPRYPACYSWVLGVGAVEPFGTDNLKTSFSNYGSEYIHLYAPGAGIHSTVTDDEYGSWSGTSMSAPIVSGVAAALMSFHPDWSLELIRGQMYNAGDPVWMQTDTGSVKMGNCRSLNLEGLFSQVPVPSLELMGTEIVSDSRDSDGEVDGDEMVEFAVELFNTWGEAQNVHATISTESIWVTISKDYGDLAYISPYATDTNGTDPFIFTVSRDVPHQNVITFDLHVDYEDSEGNPYYFDTELNFTASNVREIEGWLTETTTIEGGRYQLNQNFIVPEGMTLTIKPGVEIDLNGYDFINLGTVMAQGTRDNTIIFTTSYENIYGRIVGSIRDESSLSVYQYCEFHHVVVKEGFLPASADHCYFLDSGKGWDRATSNSGNTSISNVKYSVFELCEIGYSGLISGDQNLFIGDFIMNVHECNCKNSTFWFSAFFENMGYTGMGVTINNANILGKSFVERARETQEVCGLTGSFSRLWLRDISAVDTCTERILGSYEPDSCIFVSNGSIRDTDYTGNFWGSSVTEEFQSYEGFPFPMISVFWDYYDTTEEGKVLYDPWLSEPVEEAPPAIWRVTVYQGEEPASVDLGSEAIVQAGEINIRVDYTGPMDPLIQPSVRFGVAAPYNQHAFTGDWVDTKTWVGTATVDRITGDGIQYVNITGGSDAEENWFTPPDFYYYCFNIDTGGINAETPLFTDQWSGLRLSWVGIEDENNPNFIGYRIYRKEGVSSENLADYDNLSESMGFIGISRYLDTNVQDGNEYSYRVTAIDRDMNEVPFADGSHTYYEPEPPSTIDGQIDLEGRPNPPHTYWSVPLEVYVQLSGQDASQYDLTSDTSGVFTLPTDITGESLVGITKANCLVKALTVNLSGVVPVDFGTLLEGDVNGDDIIDISDFGILKNRFWSHSGDGTYDGLADFNGDTYVNISDFGIFKGNFMESGDMHLFNFGAASAMSASAYPSVGSVLLYIDPVTGSYEVGDTFQVTVNLEAGSAEEWDGVQFNLGYDSTVLEAISVTSLLGSDWQMLTGTDDMDNAGGNVNVALANLGGTETGSSPLATITFRCKSNSEASTITIGSRDRFVAKVVKSETGMTYSLDLNPASVTVTGSTTEPPADDNDDDTTTTSLVYEGDNCRVELDLPGVTGGSLNTGTDIFLEDEELLRVLEALEADPNLREQIRGVLSELKDGREVPYLNYTLETVLEMELTGVTPLGQIVIPVKVTRPQDGSEVTLLVLRIWREEGEALVSSEEGASFERPQRELESSWRSWTGSETEGEGFTLSASVTEGSRNDGDETEGTLKAQIAVVTASEAEQNNSGGCNIVSPLSLIYLILPLAFLCFGKRWFLK